MLGKSIMLAIAMFVITSSGLAQEKKPVFANKANSTNSNSVYPATSDKRVNTQKFIKQKSLNPDRPDFVGVPAIIVDPNSR